MASTSILMFFSLAFYLFLIVCPSAAQLSTDYYASSCPDVFLAVRTVVERAISRERRMGASVLRLFFHDCFVNGCDGSLLLDNTLTFTGEKNATPNRNSARGFEVIDDIKTAVEAVCPGVVSCADIIAIAARDSVNILGGPSWKVKLGRRDARTASFLAANIGIPPPTLNLDGLIVNFAAHGLNTTDMVALAGAHTIGYARCTNYRSHIYTDTNINATYAQSLRANCSAIIGSGDDNLAPLDVQTDDNFDNNYYKNLVNHKGLLHSDQELYNNGMTDAQVQSYSSDMTRFWSDFAAAMIKMGDISPLTAPQGEIRKNCRVVNNSTN